MTRTKMPTFERNRSHDYVAREVKAVQQDVGGIEIANFAKHEFKGPGARAYLDYGPWPDMSPTPVA